MVICFSHFYKIFLYETIRRYNFHCFFIFLKNYNFRYNLTSKYFALNLMTTNFFNFSRCIKHEFGIVPWNFKAPGEQSSNDEGQIYDSPMLHPFLFPSATVRHFRKAVWKMDAQVYRPAKRTHRYTQTGKMNEPAKIKSSDRRPEINKRFQETLLPTRLILY